MEIQAGREALLCGKAPIVLSFLYDKLKAETPFSPF